MKNFLVCVGHVWTWAIQLMEMQNLSKQAIWTEKLSFRALRLGPEGIYFQCRSEAGAEGSVTPSLNFLTNILMHFCEDLRNFMYRMDVLIFLSL
jgi:hypothetical protein